MQLGGLAASRLSAAIARRRSDEALCHRHMNTSIDGRTWGSRWRPAENRMAGLFERIHERLGNGSWLIARGRSA